MLPAEQGPVLSTKKAPATHSPKKSSASRIEVTPNVVVPANLDAAAVIYRASVLEDMKLFKVVDYIVEQFQTGKLPLSRGASSAIYDYVKNQPDRLNESERRSLYAHVLGQGSGAATPNRNFDGLMRRFLAAVSKWQRRATLPKAKVALHASARDLALNLSNRSYGAPTQAAKALAKQVEFAQAILDNPEIQKAYGFKTNQGVVAQIEIKELHIKVNVQKQRSKAEAGASVLNWLGKVANPLSSSGGADEVANDLAETRVPKSIRTLKRLTKTKKRPKAISSDYAEVFTLCYDAKKRLVPCTVDEKD